MGSSTFAGDEIARNWQAGLALQRAGRFQEASDCLHAVLAADPAHADALHLLGVMEQNAGNYRQSAELISAALRIRPQSGDYHNNLANTYKLDGDLRHAADSYLHAFALNSRNLYALDNLARVQSELGQREESRQTSELVATLRRQFAAELCLVGDSEKERGNLPAAAGYYQRAIALQSGGYEPYLKLADAFFLQKRFGPAAQFFRVAATIEPGNSQLHFCHGVALQAGGELLEAAKAYHRALQLNPNDSKVLTNLAAVFTERGNLTLAADLLKRSLKLEPNSAVAFCNLGTVLSKQGHAAVATECFQRALELNPGDASSLCNLGLQCELSGDLEGGASFYRQALATEPQSPRTRFFLSQVHLAKGDFETGWKEYELRWATPNFLCIQRNFRQPQWRGQPIAGQRIFVFAEQGLGDTLQFVRYLRLLAEAGAEVTFEVQPRLYPLLRNVAGAARVICPGEPLPEFDWQCPLMSLPAAFGTRLESIPQSVPYVYADIDRALQWSGRLDHDRLRVGIAWAGNPSHTRERQRSIPLEKLARLSRISGAVFYSLQKGAAARQVDTLPKELPIVDLDRQQQDFADTAAIVANLDLVLSIDTSVAHLAGAMGKPVWILLHNAPDWRWMQHREDSPWYPTARLFRQSAPGDWDGVLDRVETAMAELLAARWQLA